MDSGATFPEMERKLFFTGGGGLGGGACRRVRVDGASRNQKATPSHSEVWLDGRPNSLPNLRATSLDSGSQTFLTGGSLDVLGQGPQLPIWVIHCIG